ASIASWLLHCLRVAAPPPCSCAPILNPCHCFLLPVARSVPALHYAGTPCCSDLSW
ncbi:hypothetical protein ZWY2020_010839, partial [Hordeum vulgare]